MLEIADLIIKAGGNVNSKDIFGKTPFDYAAYTIPETWTVNKVEGKTSPEMKLGLFAGKDGISRD